MAGIEPMPTFTGVEGMPIAMAQPEVSKSIEMKLAEFATKNIPATVAVSPVVRHGAAFEEIVGLAKIQNVDLIITSTHGHSGLTRVLFGRTAERIVQHAPCPVLVVRDREHEFVSKSPGAGRESDFRLQRILTPTDFSECSKKALQYALQYAVAFAKEFGSEIFGVHVLDIPYGAGEAGIIIETQAFQKSLQESAERQMTSFLEQAAPIRAEGDIKLGSTYREILRATDERQADLIVLGTHGRSGLGHFLLGSMTERVLRHAKCPVLVVREREHEFIEDTGKKRADRF
jgi:universal stress protein A